MLLKTSHDQEEKMLKRKYNDGDIAYLVESNRFIREGKVGQY